MGVVRMYLAIFNQYSDCLHGNCLQPPGQEAVFPCCVHRSDWLCPGLLSLPWLQELEPPCPSPCLCWQVKKTSLSCPHTARRDAGVLSPSSQEGPCVPSISSYEGPCIPLPHPVRRDPLPLPHPAGRGIQPTTCTLNAGPQGSGSEVSGSSRYDMLIHGREERYALPWPQQMPLPRPPAHRALS